MNVIGSEIKFVEACSQNLHQEASGYLRILKHLILIEHALAKDYSNRSVWADLERLLGEDLIGILRDPRATRRIRRPMFLRVRRVLRHKFAEVRRQVIEARLPCKYHMPTRAHV